MGWTFSHRPAGVSHKDFFAKEFTWQEHPDWGIIDAAQGNPREVYLACRVEDNHVIAIVCLVSWRRDDHFNFGYKDMSEDMGPYYYNCPERILNQLTDYPFAEYAKQQSDEWRAKCREQLAQRKAIPALRTGLKLRLAATVTFRNGAVRQELGVADAKHRIFYDSQGKRYRLRRENLFGAIVIPEFSDVMLAQEV